MYNKWIFFQLDIVDQLDFDMSFIKWSFFIESGDISFSMQCYHKGLSSLDWPLAKFAIKTPTFCALLPARSQYIGMLEQ